MFSPQVLYLILSFFLLSHAKLQLLFEYSRHGARSPEAFHNAELFPEGIKKITAEGLYQHYLIGAELRERYVKSQAFLPETIGPNSLEIKVYAASNLVRTFSSALSQLLGLYPDSTGPEINTEDIERILPPFELSAQTLKENQAAAQRTGNRTSATLHGVGIIMINQIQNKEDLFFQGFEAAFCPKVAELIEKIEHNEENQRLLQLWRATLFPQLVEVLQRDWNVTGLDPSSMTFSSVKHIYDLWASLAFHKRRGMELHLTETLLQDLRKAYLHVMYFAFESLELAVKAGISLLVEDITQKIAMKIKKVEVPQFKDLKFVFYSGRDRQINALLHVLMQKSDRLKLREEGVAFFASVFLMELHESDEIPGYFFIKVWLNDEPLKMKCGEVVGQCEIGEFLKLLRTAVSDNIYRDCGSEIYRFAFE